MNLIDQVNRDKQKLLEFNTQFLVPFVKELEHASDDMLALRARLIQEESLEFLDTVPNTVEHTNELADLYYVTIGSYADLGLRFRTSFLLLPPTVGTIINKAAEAVHSLSGTKFCRNRIQTSLDALTFHICIYADLNLLPLDEVFNNIHNKNMNKLWTHEHYERYKPIVHAQKWVASWTGKGYVVKDTKGKVIKPSEVEKYV